MALLSSCTRANALKYTHCGYERGAAAAALREVTKQGGPISEGTVKALEELIKDIKGGGYARGEAAKALGEIANQGGPISEETVKALKKLVKDFGFHSEIAQKVRGKAIGALDKIANQGGPLSKEAVKALEELAKGSNTISLTDDVHKKLSDAEYKM